MRPPHPPTKTYKLPKSTRSKKKKRFYRDLNPDYKDQNLGC